MNRIPHGVKKDLIRFFSTNNQLSRYQSRSTSYFYRQPRLSISPTLRTSLLYSKTNHSHDNDQRRLSNTEASPPKKPTTPSNLSPEQREKYDSLVEELHKLLVMGIGENSSLWQKIKAANPFKIRSLVQSLNELGGETIAFHAMKDATSRIEGKRARAFDKLIDQWIQESKRNQSKDDDGEQTVQASYKEREGSDILADLDSIIKLAESGGGGYSKEMISKALQKILEEIPKDMGPDESREVDKRLEKLQQLL
jgi:hypothetical protein